MIPPRNQDLSEQFQVGDYVWINDEAYRELQTTSIGPVSRIAIVTRVAAYGCEVRYVKYDGIGTGLFWEDMTKIS